MWLKKFKLLCWKNWILVKRHWIQAIFEILFPIAIVLLFSSGRDHLEPSVYPQRIFKPFITNSSCSFGGSTFYGISLPTEGISEIGFYPNDPFYSEIIKNVAKTVNLTPIGWETEDELNLWIRNETIEKSVISIEFDNATHIPLKHLKYTIRLPQHAGENLWETDQIYYSSPSRQSRMRYDYPSDPPYQHECFLMIQNEIDREFIRALKNTTLPSLKLQAFPYPSITEDPFLTMAAAIFPVLFVLCMIMSVKNVIKNITVEIETSLKESMKMMGLSSSIHWFSWFTKCFIMLIIPFTINCILMTSKLVSEVPMFMYSNPIIVWILFGTYIVSVIAFCFLMSAIFKKSSTAGNVGSLLFFIMILPYNYLMNNFHGFPYIIKAIYCMITNTNMGQALYFIMNIESREQGVNFSTLFHRDIDLRFSFGEILFYMLLGSALMLLLTNYIERVFPGEYGISEPFYYPLMPMLNYLKKRMGYRTLENEAILQERKVSNPDIEDEPENGKIGIKIQNLSKKYGHKYAVNKLSLNMYEDQITVLLGHNGAGKTTTMSMIVGLFSPTSGTAYLNGKDIRTEKDEARVSLGICPQHNVLFEELTVKEHLQFFCALKGMENKQMIAEDIKKYIDLLELTDKINAEAKTLSGGMKRKLSIAIALCGNAKIVILDEPTSGIDVAARRHLWDLLIAEKKNRTILLSTHFMDEADVLGDRIAIMTEGRLRTVGSSFFLKKKFGTGYRLTCVKRDGFKCDNIKAVVERYAPGSVYLECEGQSEATYVISEDKLPVFENIFKDLEDNLDDLKINNFGCSLTTLEEVFLKLGVESYDDETDGRQSDQVPINLQEEINYNVQGTALIFYQIEAVLIKKFHILRRTWKQILYIAIFSAWMIFVLMSAPKISFNEVDPLKISFDTYHDTTTILESDNEEMTKSYASLFGGKDKLKDISGGAEGMSNHILKKYNESFSHVSKEYMIGATFKKDTIIAWFNGQPYHTSPLTLNTINRALVKSLVGNDFDITVTNKPYNMPTKGSDNIRDLFEDPKNVIMALIILFFLLTYWPVIFIAPYIKERESRAKLLMFISGMNRYVYWITSFIFDYFVLFIICTVLIAAIGAFQKPHFSTGEELATVLVIAMNYGFGYLPFIYAFSYLFMKYSTGESILSLLSLLFAVAYGVVMFIDNFENYHFISKTCYWILLLFAPFNLVDQLKKLGISFLVTEPDFSLYTFKESGIVSNIAMSIVGAILFLAFCIVKDHLIFEEFFYKYMSLRSKKLPPLQTAIMDDDVKDEIDKVKSMSQQQINKSILVLKGLTRMFYEDMCAVNQLHLDIEEKECFGLLGVNGAGKTSCFKMMVGDEIISDGDGFVKGFSMKNQLQNVHKLIGYCPQFDAVLPELTGRETLKIYALIRGIPKREINEKINSLSHEFGFNQHLNKSIKAFSGGNKRKLSTSLAVLGDPQLIFLDEPTTGIDPQAKHHMWGVIKKIRDSGRAVVITSHSMDECEALCTKIGIMVNGEFKCLGSVQYLKNKYSKGFVLTIKMGRDDEQLSFEIQERVKHSFSSAELKEKYLDILTFHITNVDLKWSQVFAICSELKRELNICDYALTQMSLEQVFLIFSRRSGMYQEV